MQGHPCIQSDCPLPEPWPVCLGRWQYAWCWRAVFLLLQPAPAQARIYPTTARSEEHTSELQSLMRISYAVFCLKKKKQHSQHYTYHSEHLIDINTNATLTYKT